MKRNLARCGLALVALTFGLAEPATATTAVSTTWSQAHPPTSAYSRTQAAMAYDPGIGKLVLFGGRGASHYYADTWTFDGSTWRRLSTTVSPPARIRGRMAWDPAIGKLVPYGGTPAQYGAVDTDTWTFDGTTWTEVPTAHNPGYAPSIPPVFDPDLNALVLMGTEDTPAHHLWTFDGTDWSSRTATTVPTIPVSDLVYDTALGELLDVGADQTWRYTGTTWTKLNTTGVPDRAGGQAVYDASAGLVVWFEDGQVKSPPETWTFDGTTWTLQSPQVSPPSRDTEVVAYDNALSRVVLFGGEDSTTYLADTWTFTTVPPAIAAVTPNAGSVTGGTTVTITGSAFTGATAVRFASTAAASFHVDSATQITAVTPAKGVGSYNVEVTTPGGTSAAGHVYRYVAPPAVTSLSPASGTIHGGTTVNIVGSGFTGATTVMFGSYPAASFHVISPTHVTAITPAEPSGSHNVIVTTPVATSATIIADRFTFTS